MTKKYNDLSDSRKKAIAENAREWAKKNRVSLISNVRPETRDLFQQVHQKLTTENITKSKEDTIIYVLKHFLEKNT